MVSGNGIVDPVRVVFAWKAKTMLWNRTFVPFSIKRNLLRMETLLSESIRVGGK